MSQQQPRLLRAAAAASALLAVLAFLPGPGAHRERADRPTGALAPGGETTDPGLTVPGAAAELRPIVTGSARHDTSPALRSIAPLRPLSARNFEKVEEAAARDAEQLPNRDLGAPADGSDPATQRVAAAGSTPEPLISFPGLSNDDNAAVTGSTYWPPDANGDVGAGYYVQTVNVTLAVFTGPGTRVWGPASINTLWSGFGGMCETHADGDPIAVFDELASRWLVSEFALDHQRADYHECVAISATSDPTGRWYRYDFQHPKGFAFGDYPKFGVWPDGYYMAVNQFAPNFTWSGAGAIVYERERMLNGQSARLVYFDLAGKPLSGMLPSDLDGATPPPEGAANLFAQIDDDAWGYGRDQLELWAFHVDWAQTGSSTFERLATLPTASFSSTVCGSAECIDQPDTTRNVDELSDRLMQRLQYRNFGDHQTLVTSHTVGVGGGQAAVRWYELRNTSGTWSVQQQGTYAPDGDSRWMSSAAMDAFGNIAVGYSVAGASTFPSVRYAGRAASDPLGTLGAETALVAGGGSQTGTGRWGDYSAMSVDPGDGCTFWYTQEHYSTTSSTGWRTRIGAFRFPDCQTGTPPSPAEVSGATLGRAFQRSLKLPLGWTADGGQPPLAYDVRSRRAPWSGGFLAFTTWQSSTSATGGIFQASPGNTYCLSARAIDQSLNQGEWGSEVCTAFPMNETSLARHGTWTRKKAAGYYLGDYVVSRKKGSSLTRSGVSATRLAVIVTTCPTCGGLKVFWNGTRLQTLSLVSSTRKKLVVIEVVSFPTEQSGTLQLVVTTDGKPVKIGGVGTSVA